MSEYKPAEPPIVPPPAARQDPPPVPTASDQALEAARGLPIDYKLLADGNQHVAEHFDEFGTDSHRNMEV